MKNVQVEVSKILQAYERSFNEKKFESIAAEPDVLMNAFGITMEMVEKNKQYWNRELGKCWERVVSKVFEVTRSSSFKPAQRIGADEPIDFVFKNLAIDTKYRVGSGDSGTLKKFKQYGEKIRALKMVPVFLFLRTDNLPAAITACRSGSWEILMGDETFQFIFDETGFDLKAHLVQVAAQRIAKT